MCLWPSVHAGRTRARAAPAARRLAPQTQLALKHGVGVEADRVQRVVVLEIVALGHRAAASRRRGAAAGLARAGASAPHTPQVLIAAAPLLSSPSPRRYMLRDTIREML